MRTANWIGSMYCHSPRRMGYDVTLSICSTRWVRRRAEIVASGDAAEDVPLANVEAMYRTFLDYRYWLVCGRVC